MNDKLEDMRRKRRYAITARDEKLAEAKKFFDEILALEIDIAAMEQDELEPSHGSPD